jgi:ribosomal protein L7/L12
MTTITREPKNVAWLKQRIKNLPDHYTIYFQDEHRDIHPLGEIKIEEHAARVGLMEGKLDLEIEALLAEGKKILAVKLYREFTGSSLMEAKNFVDALQDKMNERVA